MRTLMTQSLAVLMPFNVQELYLPGKGGTYYGVNQVSRNILFGNRKRLVNGNGFIFGVPGSGKEHPALVAFAKYQSIETLICEILTDLVDHIKIYENGNISVHFKFADEFRRIAEYIEINTIDTAEAG